MKVYELYLVLIGVAMIADTAFGKLVWHYNRKSTKSTSKSKSSKSQSKSYNLQSKSSKSQSKLSESRSKSSKSQSKSSESKSESNVTGSTHEYQDGKSNSKPGQRTRKNENYQIEQNANSKPIPKSKGQRDQNSIEKQRIPIEQKGRGNEINKQDTRIGRARNVQFSIFELAISDKVIYITEPDKINPGDLLVWNNDIFDGSNVTNKIGMTSGNCVTTTSITLSCLYTFEFNNELVGKITVQGLSPEVGNSTRLAITGGTKDYEGSTGSVVLFFPPTLERPPVFEYQFNIYY
mmetsp:Transcript_41819/g.61403  ORF Transcript_41819/g.61403 Transcript_41819/m.61403 type:complete len:292 (+) Transcript_41819:47-922(+)